MKRTFFLAPISGGCGLTTISLGLLRTLDQRGVRVGFCKPVGQTIADEKGSERSTYFVRAITDLKPASPISLEEAEKMVSEGRFDDLMSLVIQEFHDSARDADVMVVEGLVPMPHHSYIGQLNAELIQTLSAQVILVGTAGSTIDRTLRDQIDFASRQYGGAERTHVAGIILNHLKPETGEDVQTAIARVTREYQAVTPPLPALAGLVPENEALMQCRTRDIARHLKADILFPGAIDQRRVKAIHLVARTVPNMLHTFRPGAILVTPADRSDVIIAASMAALNNIPMAGLVLTGTPPLAEPILQLCQPGIATGLPILRVNGGSYETASLLSAMNSEVPIDDLQRIEAAMDFVSEHIDDGWLEHHCSRELESRLSPAAFLFQLTERARAANRRILLPEGSEPRTVQAAAICAQRGLARCVLLGNPEEIRQVAVGQDIDPDLLEIIDIDSVRANYIAPMVELRTTKRLSPQIARDHLEDDVVVGTMMLALGEADGLVSGAIHSSANTVRPALQLIKAKPGVKAVSSIFFMCLPDQVLVYGDCAVIPDPDAETLADIAIQSAESAIRFGLPARVAMISYSTGESGSGADVEKVRQATRIAQQRRPDLLIDGPLQYDAAAIASVAAQKAPDSPVAGRATVFIFPDLNTGNTTYKAVQRSASVLSIGPMLQGLRRPVNDLSRGALVEDIVYTIALTAAQVEDE